MPEDGTFTVTPRAGTRTMRLTQAPAGIATKSPAPNQWVTPEATSNYPISPSTTSSYSVTSGCQ